MRISTQRFKRSVLCNEPERVATILYKVLLTRGFDDARFASFKETFTTGARTLTAPIEEIERSVTEFTSSLSPVPAAATIPLMLMFALMMMLLYLQHLINYLSTVSLHTQNS